MQKYSVRPSDIHLSDGDCCKMVCTRVYRASEVDARIAELEKALHGILGYFRSGNSIPVERATIKADAPEIIFAKSVL